MFVLCALQSQDNQDKEVVQIKYREQKKNAAWGMDVCLL
jgi:hypothetical protein